jgi:hypothetical protein
LEVGQLNTQGWIRGLMAKNQNEEKFFEHVVTCLGREFEIESSLVKQKDNYIVDLGSYSVIVPNTTVAILKSKGPYCLDAYILDKLQAEGYRFDKYRSQYVRYCYELFYRTESGSVY